MTVSGIRSWQDELEVLTRRWEFVDEEELRAERHIVERWRDELDRMARDERRLRADGMWTSGPPELMAVLGLHRDEVRNCRVVRWLLDPEAPHGLGSRLLVRFLSRVIGEDDLPEALLSATIEVEVPMDGGETEDVVRTRADILIRMPGVLVVVEAKTFAPESRGQCARIEEVWEPEAPTLVFLTRRGRRPESTERPDRWRLLAWTEIADDLELSLRETESSTAPGRPAAIEYLRALRRYL